MLPGGNLWQVLPDELYKNSRMLTQFDDKSFLHHIVMMPTQIVNVFRRRDEVKSLKDSKDTGALPMFVSFPSPRYFLIHSVSFRALSCGGLSLAKIAPIENVNESNGQFGISDQ